MNATAAMPASQDDASDKFRIIGQTKDGVVIYAPPRTAGSISLSGLDDAIAEVKTLCDANRNKKK